MSIWRRIYNHRSHLDGRIHTRMKPHGFDCIVQEVTSNLTIGSCPNFAKNLFGDIILVITNSLFHVLERIFLESRRYSGKFASKIQNKKNKKNSKETNDQFRRKHSLKKKHQKVNNQKRD